jgi:hypothetical protein
MLARPIDRDRAARTLEGQAGQAGAALALGSLALCQAACSTQIAAALAIWHSDFVAPWRWRASVQSPQRRSD